MVVNVVFLGVFCLFRSGFIWIYVMFFQVFIVVFCVVKIEWFLVWKGGRDRLLVVFRIAWDSKKQVFSLNVRTFIIPLLTKGPEKISILLAYYASAAFRYWS